MRLTNDNYEQVLRLFSSNNQGRINEMNTRINGERAISPSIVGDTWRPGPNDTSLIGLSFDDVSSRMNPNHIRGMDATNRPDWRQIIDLPDYMVEAMQTLAREQFARNFNGLASWRDGERQALLQQSFLRELPEQDRLAANWTLQQINLAESMRIESAVREAIPGWQLGQRVPDEILSSILNGTGRYNVMA